MNKEKMSGYNAMLRKEANLLKNLAEEIIRRCNKIDVTLDAGYNLADIIVPYGFSRKAIEIAGSCGIIAAKFDMLVELSEDVDDREPDQLVLIDK